MADDTIPPATALVAAPPSSAQAHRRLMVLFLHGLLWPGLTTIFLSFLALELSWAQWLKLMPLVPPAMTLFFVPEAYLVHRLFRPIGAALTSLSGGGPVSAAVISRGLVHTLNMPYYAFLRIVLIRGTIGSFAALVSLYGVNLWYDGGFQTWQIVMFPALVFFFACPLYAMIEYFAVSRHLEPLVALFWQHCSRLELIDQRRLVAVRLKTKLLYLCFFITTLPLLFLAATIFYKVYLLLDHAQVDDALALMLPMARWTVGALVVSIVGALAVSLLTASEVSRAALRLIGGMNEVERGNLDVDIKVLGTDEYADLTRGFNLMTGGLREEVQLLEVSQALAGELKLDVLIVRIMNAAADLLGADRGTLFLHDAEKHELYSLYAEGVTLREIRIPEHSGIAGAVFDSGRMEIVTDVYVDPRFRRDIDVATGYLTRNMLCVPIVNKTGQCIGVTQVLNKHEGRFNARDERRLMAFTSQIAVALENARLFDEVLAIKNYNENILASTTNGVITLDTQRRVVTANAAALRLLGVPASALMRRPADEVFGAANGWVLDVVERVMRNGVSTSAVDSDLCHPDGTRASVNLTANPLLDPGGAGIGSLLSFEDFSREKRVRSTMSRYMSPQVASRLLEAGETVLEGQLQTVSILFSDVRGFTHLSERLGPRETVSLLNAYFEQMVEVVFSHHGILDKYIGDAIMALFGSPFTGPLDADNAVASACDMMAALREFNRGRAAKSLPLIEIGIGIATGDVVVGNIGSQRRMEYTVIGDAVNLAARLESATKHYGVGLLLAESTVAALKTPVPVRLIDRIRVKGKDHAVTIYEALGHHDAQSFAKLEACTAIYDAGIEAGLARDWALAMEAFEQVLALNPDDRPAQIHLERCAHYLDHPPAAHWDGVWTLRDK